MFRSSFVQINKTDEDNVENGEKKAAPVQAPAAAPANGEVAPATEERKKTEANGRVAAEDQQ